MRKLTALFALLSAIQLTAQPVDNKKNPSVSTPNARFIANYRDSVPLPMASFDLPKPTTFEEYLVLLAWQNSPELEGQKYDIDARKEEISLAKKEWTRNIQAGLNMNDVSFPYFLVNTLKTEYFFGQKIDLTKVPQVATYPLWNIGVGVNFGDLIVRKNKVRFAENRKKMSEAEMNFKKQKLRGEVLKRYQDYISTFEILKVRLQALDAAEANKTQISNLFSINKAKFEDYNTANKAYFDALEGKVRTEAEIKIKRIALEELLGVRWEQVERVQESYKK